MGFRQSSNLSSIPADIVARDRDGRIVLAVEIKAPRADGQPPRPDSQLLKWAVNHPEQPRPYLMTAHAHGIFIFSPNTIIPAPRDVPRGASQVLDVDVTLDTGSILAFYDHSLRENAGAETIHYFYLRTLIEFWLDDLATNWKSPHPPCEAKFNEIGLLTRLKGGSVEAEDPDDDPLR